MDGRVFIIHGWGGTPRGAWRGWLADELTKIGVEVINPSMPAPDHPRCDAWVRCLSQVVGSVTGKDFFVGHSLGPIAIFRYLESLPEGAKVGGVVSVAGFISTLDNTEIDSFFQTPLNCEKIKELVHEQVFAINSDDDEYVPVEKSQEIERKLAAELLMMNKAGHINQDAGYIKLPQVLEKLKSWMK